MNGKIYQSEHIEDADNFYISFSGGIVAETEVMWSREEFSAAVSDKLFEPAICPSIVDGEPCYGALLGAINPREICFAFEHSFGHFGFTAETSELIEIHFADNYIVRCSPEQRFLRSDGELIEAKNIKESMEFMAIDSERKIGNKVICERATAVCLDKPCKLYTLKGEFGTLALKNGVLIEIPIDDEDEP